MMVSDRLERARICSVRTTDGGARLWIEVESADGEGASRERLALLTARLTRVPLIGPIDEETLYRVRREALICAAIDAGLRCLGAGNSSKRRLIDKLRARGFNPEVAVIATEELSVKGYLKEEESALREAEKGIKKMWGDRRILADLAAKGYQGGALKYAEAMLNGEDSVARCAMLISRRRMEVPTDEAEVRKFFVSLMRYGYTPDQIKKALQK